MKTTLKNIKNVADGYIGTIVDRRYGRINLLNQCYKTDNEIKVIDGESRGPNFFTVEEFVRVYKNRKLQIL